MINIESLKTSFQVLGVKTMWAQTMLQLLKLDIAHLLKANPDFSFVAKKEVARWPVFGSAAVAAQTIFVQRGNGNSRAAAREAIGEALKNNIMIQPFRISYSPIRPAASIGKDFFPVHLYQLAGLQKIQTEVEFPPLVATTFIVIGEI